MRAIDISTYTGELSASVVGSLKQEHVDRVIVQLQNYALSEKQLKVLNNQFNIHLYTFFDGADINSGIERVKSFINYCRSSNIAQPDILWIDVEDNEYIQNINYDQLITIIDSFAGVIRTGIYTNKTMWEELMGDNPVPPNMPMWIANWGKNRDLNFPTFGGISTCAMKQLMPNVTVGGVLCDDNYYETETSPNSVVVQDVEEPQPEETPVEIEIGQGDIISTLDIINKSPFNFRWYSTPDGYRLVKIS